jgi:hypothetical protein
MVVALERKYKPVKTTIKMKCNKMTMAEARAVNKIMPILWIKKLD